MSVDPNNPWKTDVCGVLCAYSTVQDCLNRVKSMTADELRAAIAWPDTKKTVRQAAERRLRKLEGKIPHCTQCGIEIGSPGLCGECACEEDMP